MVLLLAALAAMRLALFALRPESGEGFYAHLSHAAMVAIFLPAFLAPLLLLAVACALIGGSWAADRSGCTSSRARSVTPSRSAI